MTINTSTRRGLALALSAGALTAGLLTGHATAAEPTAPRDSAGVALTATERDRLDAEVAETLRETPGGERIAPNRIAWPDQGAVLTIPLPGEQRARTLDDPIGTAAQCTDGHVCLYEDARFEGEELEFYYCKFQKLRWYDFTNKVSSWINNQTDGTNSSLYTWDGSEVDFYANLIAPDSDSQVADNDRADFLEVC